MYLSKLILDPRHPQARRDLGNAYELHRTLSRVFALDEHTAPARFLWRLERNLNNASPVALLVQAQTAPDWQSITAMAGYCQLQPNKAVDLDALIQPSRRFRFRLQANPTVTRDGKRYGLHREEEQQAWLMRQGEKYGFNILACLRGYTDRINVRQASTGRRIVLDSALFDGLLETSDAEKLRKVVLDGIGHGKALGQGLLSLAPVAR